MELQKNLISRGKDATGFAWINNTGKIQIFKRAVNPEDFNKKFSKKLKEMDTCIAIGHNRAATTNVGEKTKDTEAHPFISEDGKVALVHNGHVSDYILLKKLFSAVGHKFETGIDSECLLHLAEEILIKEKDPSNVITKFRSIAEGNVLFLTSDNEIYGFPGVCPAFFCVQIPGGYIVASELQAILKVLEKEAEEAILFYPSTGAIAVRIRTENKKIIASFFGTWTKTSMKKGKFIFDSITMCDFCKEHGKPCEKIEINKSKYDRCYECHKNNVTAPKYESTTTGYACEYLDARGTRNYQKKDTSSVPTSTKREYGICGYCYLPVMNEDNLVYCDRCKTFFCRFDFKRHKCAEQDDKFKDFQLFEFLSEALTEDKDDQVADELDEESVTDAVKKITNEETEKYNEYVKDTKKANPAQKRLIDDG